jgi:soluble lytic murein transglycosylase-like protein
MTAEHSTPRSGPRRTVALDDDAHPTDLLPRLAGPVAAPDLATAPTQAEVSREAVEARVLQACRGAQRVTRPGFKRPTEHRDRARTLVMPSGGRVSKRAARAARAAVAAPRRVGHAPFVALALVALFVARPAGDVRPLSAPIVADETPSRFEEIDRVLMLRGTDLPASERRAVARAIAEESDKAGYDPYLVLGLIDVESDFRRDAVSPVGAQGLMQIKPDTLAWLARKNGVNLPTAAIAKDPALSVRLGVRYLAQLHDQFHSVDLALMAYNIGPNKVAQLAQEHHGLDPYWGYVNNVHHERDSLQRALESALAVAQR